MITALIIGSYVLYHYSQELPDYAQLKKYYPPSVTRVYSADGKLIEEYARERRIFVPISSIPKSLSQAFIAAEDKNFYHHSGIDIVSIIRAAVTNVSHLLNNRRVEGGSTITQQVVKNFLLTSERSLERKIKEAMLSYMVSQVLTKDEILELYLNQIYLGKGAYGVATAALNYFNKSVEELTLNESALLASLPKAPSRFNPSTNYQRAFIRKNYVIARMFDDDYITEQEAKEAIAKPITLAKFNKLESLDADYYAAKVREEVINMFGEEYFYTAGLTIITCLDSHLQNHAADALRFGIKKYDMNKGYRGPIKNIDLINWQNELKYMPKPTVLRDYKLAVILNISNNSATIGLTNGSTSSLLLKDTKWAAKNIKSLNRILKIGDIIIIQKSGKNYSLQQIPKVNGGIMVVEHSTGRVLAAEGGYDFTVSKFDRTIHAKRQPGSAIKPFVYLAALENGARPNDLFVDEPVEIFQGPNLPMWKPQNYERNFLGPITMRAGLEKSRNIITIKVGQFAGINKVASTIQRFGINDQFPIVPSIVLGAIETTLSRMVMAYSTIANNGRKVEPHYIELIKDRKGNIIYKRDYSECIECKAYMLDDEATPIPPTIYPTKGRIITDDATSYQITSLMMGGVQRGTSRKAKHLNHVIAGKTGTTNNAKDTWFIGYTPQITVGTYIGYDNPASLGGRASGATVALPVFVKFMKTAYKHKPLVEFAVPKSIQLKSIDYNTGKLSNEKNAILEAFKTNKYNPLFEKNKDSILHRTHDPFRNIQESGRANELY